MTNRKNAKVPWNDVVAWVRSHPEPPFAINVERRFPQMKGRCTALIAFGHVRATPRSSTMAKANEARRIKLERAKNADKRIQELEATVAKLGEMLAKKGA